MSIAVTTGASMPASCEVVQVLSSRKSKHKLINCLADEFTQKLSGDTYMEIELEELNHDEEKDQDQSAEED